MTIQERVWLNRQPNGTEELFFVQQDDGDTPYVPEHRALAAERERDEANKELLLLHAQYRQVSNLEALRVREIAALRAERDNWKTIAFGHLERAQQAEAKTLDDAVALANQVNTERNKALQNLMQLEQDWIRERDALRADLKALLPLARAGLNAYDYAMAKQVYGHAEVPVLDGISIMESLTAARAILARVATEGTT